MTIILERPDTEAVQLDTHPDLPVADLQAVGAVWPSAASPFGTPASPPASEAALPPGVRLVRRRTTATPTATLGRRLTMLAPVALLAGVSAGAVTLMPHLQGLVDDVRGHLGDTAAAATPHTTSLTSTHIAQTEADATVPHRAGPKHRGATSTTPAAAQLPQLQQPQGKHRAPTSAGTHAAPSAGAGDTAAPAKASGGKHKAAPTPSGDQTADQAPPSGGSTPPSTTPPSTTPPATQPAPGPVQTVVNDATKTVTGLATGLLGG